MVTFILMTVVIDAMGIGLIIPVMPALLRELGNIPLADAALWGGVLSTVFADRQFLFGPIIGSQSGRFGRRPVLLFSLLGRVVGAHQSVGRFQKCQPEPTTSPTAEPVFLYQIALFVYSSVWSCHTSERFSWSEGMIGLSPASFGVSIALVQGELIRVFLRYLGERGTVIYGIVFNGFAFLVPPLSKAGRLH